MKRFSDLGVTVDAGSNIFQVQQVSITDILNSEIEVLDFESGVRTQHGENRYVVKIKSDGRECKFFTNSTPIKEALENLNIRLKEHYIIADGTYSGVFHDDYTMAQKINRI